jgi:uncharacterized protein YjdB
MTHLLSRAACAAFLLVTVSCSMTDWLVATIEVAPATGSVEVGAKAQLTATPKDREGKALAGRVVTWASSTTGVATVDSGTGLVTGVAVGIAQITATSEGITGSASVTVTRTAVAFVTVAPASPTLIVGATQQLTATMTDVRAATLLGRSVTWASSNTAAATVDSSGLVRAVAPGGTTITATSEGIPGTATVTVTATPVVPVAFVTVSPATATVTMGATQQLTATTKDAGGATLTGRTVTWVSSNAAVGTVSSSGVVTAVAVGSAQITATSEGINGTATVTVTQATVASVTVSPATATVTVGATQQLTATPKDAGGNPLIGRVVTWGSSNSAVATVSSGGVVTGVVAGGATITATSEGINGTAVITVTSPSGGLYPNQPPGYVVLDGNLLGRNAGLVDINWSTLALPPGWSHSASWTNPTYIQIAQEATAPQSPPDVLQYNFVTGTEQAPGSIGFSWANSALQGADSMGYNKLYISFWWRVNALWQQHPVFSKIIYFGDNHWTGLPGSPVTIASSTNTSPIVITLSAGHGYAIGSTMWGVTIANHLVNTAANGYWTRSTATSSTAFTLTGSTGNGVGGATGTASTDAPLPAQWFLVYDGNSYATPNVLSQTEGRIDVWLQAAQEPNSQRSMRAGGGGNLTPPGANGTRTTIYPGTWYHIEVLVEGNTGGAANGTLKWWVNNVLQGSHTDVTWKSLYGRFPTVGNGRFTGIDMTPIWGGSGVYKSHDDFMQFDHVYISRGP